VVLKVYSDGADKLTCPHSRELQSDSLNGSESLGPLLTGDWPKCFAAAGSLDMIAYSMSSSGNPGFFDLRGEDGLGTTTDAHCFACGYDTFLTVGGGMTNHATYAAWPV